jgi:transposase
MRQNARTERVAILLAAGWSVRATAKKCGVHERTITRWRESVEFNQRVASLRATMTNRTLGRLTASSTAAAAELKRLMTAKDDRVRLSACKVVLEQQTRFAELCDVVARIEALERASRETD